jgi:3-mercaptopyruvate sulfurtransferase SseA
VIFYSRYGIASCLGLVALHTAGLENGAHLDASWREWASIPYPSWAGITRS